MPKPKARACFSTAHEHGRATLGHGTQSVRTHQNTSDRALVDGLAARTGAVDAAGAVCGAQVVRLVGADDPCCLRADDGSE